MDPVKPRELFTAARVADGLVVVVGLAGVIAGAQLFRGGEVAFALIAWVLTFVAGAALRLVVWMARGVAQLMDRTERIEQDVARLARADDRARLLRADVAAEDQQGDDPYRRWGGWH